MGGRRRVSSDELAFYAFLDQSPAWRAFHQHLTSTAFVRALLDFLEPDIRKIAPTFDVQKVRVTPHYYRNRVWLRRFLPRPLVNGVYRLLDAVASPDEYVVHIDISSAGAGYTREIHRDTDPRVAVFLVHFSDAGDVGGTGGEFGVHSYIEPPDGISQYSRQPVQATQKTEMLIPPEKNTGVLFLSTHNSYHSVPEIRDNTGWRRFIYVGVSRRNRKPWYS
jgi:hypothetical protein